MTPERGIYRHFKGNLYELVDVAKHSESLEEMVVYRALYGERGLWVRPLSMWSEPIERDGYHGPRFTKVSPVEDEASPKAHTERMIRMKPLNQYIDHTILKPAATQAEVTALCHQAIDHAFASVCVNPCHVALCSRLLKDSGIKVCTVIGFPLGANTTATKAFEAGDAVRNGADELDMVINVGALKDGRRDAVMADIRAVVAASAGKCVKVIIETGLLTDDEKIAAVRLSAEAGAHFVKTCTGFSGGQATPEDIRLMKAHIAPGMEVKASAGIRDRTSALALIEAGADRLGTSAGLSIIETNR